MFFKELEAQASKLILSFLSIFLKICNHPALLVEGFQVQDMNGYFLKAEPEVSKRIDEFYNIQNCGKMNVNKYIYFLRDRNFKLSQIYKMCLNF